MPISYLSKVNVNTYDFYSDFVETRDAFSER